MHRHKLDYATLVKRRRNYQRLEKYFPSPRGTQINPAEIDGTRAEWISTSESRPDKIILYVHGGGFVFDTSKIHRGAIARIATASKTKVLSVNYSLAPEHPFPKALNEVVEAYKWLLEREISSKSIVFVGDSAGGNLILSALLKIRDLNLPLPAAGVALSPATDALMTGESFRDKTIKDPIMTHDKLDYFIESYVAKSAKDNPLISPLYANLQGLPPILMQVGEDEIMLSYTLDFAAKAQKAGVTVQLSIGKNMWHVWYLFAPFLPEANEAIKEIGLFIQKQLK